MTDRLTLGEKKTLIKQKTITLEEMECNDFFDFIPIGDDEEIQEKRNQLWKRIDLNGNGSLSLSEIDSTLTNLKEFKLLIKFKEAEKQAFKITTQLKADHQFHNKITKKNFEHFLQTLKTYFQFFIWFSDINKEGRTIDFEEFSENIEKLEHIWEEKIENPKEFFAKISGGDSINFEEFGEYSTHRLMEIKAQKQEEQDRINDEERQKNLALQQEQEELQRKKMMEQDLQKQNEENERRQKEELRLEQEKLRLEQKKQKQIEEMEKSRIEEKEDLDQKLLLEKQQEEKLRLEQEEKQRLEKEQRELKVNKNQDKINEKKKQLNLDDEPKEDKPLTKNEIFELQFQDFFSFAYTTSQLIAHNQLTKLASKNNQELGLLILRLLPYLGDNLEPTLKENLKIINDKIVLISALNLTSQFKNFKEVQEFTVPLSKELSKKLTKSIDIVADDSPFLKDWTDKIDSISKIIKHNIMEIDGAKEMFETSVKKFACKVCSQFVGNWFCSGRFREQTLPTTQLKVEFAQKIIKNNKFTEKFSLNKLDIPLKNAEQKKGHGKDKVSVSLDDESQQVEQIHNDTPCCNIF